MGHSKFFTFMFSVVMLLAFGFQNASAQTSTTGELTGVVTDPTKAVVPAAKVQLKDLQHGNIRETQTNDAGVYRFSLLSAGQYEVDIQASGFQPIAGSTTVSIGQVTTLDLKLSLQSMSDKVVVVEEVPMIQTENGNVTSNLSERLIQTMPNQGNDMTYPLEMTAGVIENTLGGYGNYSVNGISATGNLFTINGMDDNDPYLSLNNTGATSLMLGQGEVQEATIVSNGYGGQFGGLAGSNVNFVTKSGQDQFHGSATYYWNGRAFNANSFFNNANGAPKSFVNANQYSGEIGGPILKNKVFWYFHTEGLRLIVPTSPTTVLVPSPAFEAATIANLQAALPNSVPFYNTIFGIYDPARSAHNAVPGSANPSDPTGCGTFTALGAGVNCVYNYTSDAKIPTDESIYSWRVDYNINTKDHLFGRFQMDKGYQGSATDPINPLFNLVSNQPEYQGQISENHMFGPTVTNQFIIAGQWYEATFNAPNRQAALAAFPTSLFFVNGFSALAIYNSLGPQGRAVTQAQISDDITKIAGRHTLKFGVKYRRNDVTDLVYGINTSGTMVIPDLTAFYNGGFDPANTTDATTFSQTFPTSSEQRFKFWTFGGYAEDDIQVKSNLTLTLSLRADHPSNPTCKTSCFSRLAEPFTELVNDPVLGGANAANVPYNEIFDVSNRTALVGLTNIEWAPRFGFAWQPLGREHNTVIRGGIGIFWDSFPGQVVDNISENPPLFQNFTVGGATQPLLISPAEPNSLNSAAAASNNGFLSGFTSGATVTQLEANVPGFKPPSVNYVNNFTKVPQYQKWSLGIQQGFGKDTSVTISYTGNHGIHEAVQNSTLNAYSPTPFVGLPTAPPDPRFGFVEGIFSEGISNYNGLSVSATHRYATGSISVNYTYSHALDEISNGGFSPMTFQAFLSTNTSPIFAQTPNGIRDMYASSDYDARHYLSLNYLWELPLKRLTWGHGPDALLKGWNVSGTLLSRTGLPFTVVDLTTTASLESTNYGQTASPTTPAPYVFANVTGTAPGSCIAPGSNVHNPCFNTAAFTTSPNGFGDAGRNSMRGPGYFNTDFSIWKTFKVIPHWEAAEFNLGFQFYNIFNHPNFDNPYYDVSSPSFGTLERTVSPATTVYGVALGADASPRIIQLKVQFQF